MTDESPPSSDPWIGRTLAGYTILRLIGVGGMGVVYLGRHESLDRLAAIKFLSGHLTADSAYVQLFLREARAAAKLNHPNMVTVYDAGSVGNDVYYFIMEHVEGKDLATLQKKTRIFSARQAVEYVRQAAIALGYAHKKHIIHRDVKPENLLLTDEGTIKVADLGLAKGIGEEGAMTQSGWVLGSPFYISPERLRDAKVVDPRSDIYSLGATLYHFVTGRIPYEGSPPVVMSMHLHAPLPNPQQVNPALDYDLCDIIQRMMAKDPADRFQSMDEVQKTLTDYLAAPSHPDHLSPTEVCAAFPEPMEQVLDEQDEEEEQKPTAPQPAPIKSAATFLWRLTLLAAVVVAGLWLMRHHQATLERSQTLQEKLPERPEKPFPAVQERVVVEETRAAIPVPTAPVKLPETAPLNTIFVSPEGDETAPGTLNKPTTLTAALWKAQPGNEILVQPGTYHEAIFLPISGEKDKPIRLIADGKVVLDLRNRKERIHGIVGRDVGWWVIEGFEVIGHLQGIKLKNGHDIIVRKCKIHDGESGFALEGSSAERLLVEDIEAYNHERGGFDVASGVSMEDVIFRRCISHDNRCEGGGDAFGISHDCKAKNVRIEYCQSYNNQLDGFDVGSAGDVTFYGCVAHHNGRGPHGANFKSWRPGIKFINCVAWATGTSADGNFEARGNNILFLNCTSGENEDSGIVVLGKDVRVINCILAGSKKNAIRLRKDKNKDADCTVENTLIYECGQPGAVPLGKNRNLNANPKFVNSGEGNYRIRRGSPAAGRGQPDPELKTDADGKSRPPGKPALGAYEPP